jgi:hypothetical protein
MEVTPKKMPMYRYGSKCAKCGTECANVKHNSYSYAVGGTVHRREHMTRTCMLCGYVWHEAPLDRPDLIESPVINYNDRGDS